MFLTKLAIKNLTRNKKRTLITALVISFGIIIFLISDSLMVGMKEISIENNINLLTSHLQIMDKNYKEKNEEMNLEYLLNEQSDIIEKVKDDNKIKDYTYRLYFSANINNGREQYPVSAIGIDVNKDKDVFNLDNFILEGEMIKSGENAVIGKGLANLMGFELGDYITLLFKTKEGTFNTIDAQLVGTLDTPHPEINEYHVYIPLELAQNTLKIKGKISKYFLKLDNREQSIQFAEEINETFKKGSLDIRAYNWEELSKDILAMIRQGNIENLVMLLIIIILAAVGVINIVILSVLERLEEIGMMKALGLKVKEIIYIFIVESAGIGIIGSTIGVLIGGIGVYLLTNIGIDLYSFTGGESTFGVPITDRIYGDWNYNAFIFIYFFGIFTSILASILPARWGAKKDPVKAIYHK